MKSITILEKTYGSYKISALNAFRHNVSKELEGLEVQVKKIYTHSHDWIIVELEGEDEEAAYNLLEHYYGTTCSLEQLKIEQTRKGKLIQTGKYGFGLFIDIGIDSEKKIDAFLPLHTLRHQLTKDEKIPLRKLIHDYGFLDNLSLEVYIDSIDRLNRKIQVSLSSGQLDIFKKWIRSKLERLIVSGATRHHLKKVIIKSGHLRDIVAIERIGFLEEMIICKQGTNAPGMLSAIGSYLSDSQIQLFIPANVKNFLA